MNLKPAPPMQSLIAAIQLRRLRMKMSGCWHWLVLPSVLFGLLLASGLVLGH